MICGNQKCRGAIPDFNAKTIKIIESFLMLLNVENLKKSKIDIVIKTIEAIAWGIKYLIADSVELKFNLNRIRGITLIKLISSPNQVINQLLEEQAITVPVTKNVTKII
jgi:hypothetical protein